MERRDQGKRAQEIERVDSSAVHVDVETAKGPPVLPRTVVMPEGGGQPARVDLPATVRQAERVDSPSQNGGPERAASMIPTAVSVPLHEKTGRIDVGAHAFVVESDRVDLIGRHGKPVPASPVLPEGWTQVDVEENENEEENEVKAIDKPSIAKLRVKE